MEGEESQQQRQGRERRDGPCGECYNCKHGQHFTRCKMFVCRCGPCRSQRKEMRYIQKHNLFLDGQIPGGPCEMRDIKTEIPPNFIGWKYDGECSSEEDEEDEDKDKQQYGGFTRNVEEPDNDEDKQQYGFASSSSSGGAALGGMASGSTHNVAPLPQQEAKLNLCIACYDKEVDIVSDPCGHATVCSNCFPEIKEEVDGKKKCPICREIVDKTVLLDVATKVFMAGVGISVEEGLELNRKWIKQLEKELEEARWKLKAEAKERKHFEDKWYSASADVKILERRLRKEQEERAKAENERWDERTWRKAAESKADKLQGSLDASHHEAKKLRDELDAVYARVGKLDRALCEAEKESKAEREAKEEAERLLWWRSLSDAERKAYAGKIVEENMVRGRRWVESRKPNKRPQIQPKGEEFEAKRQQEAREAREQALAPHRSQWNSLTEGERARRAYYKFQKDNPLLSSSSAVSARNRVAVGKENEVGEKTTVMEEDDGTTEGEEDEADEEPKKNQHEQPEQDVEVGEKPEGSKKIQHEQPEQGVDPEPAKDEGRPSSKHSVFQQQLKEYRDKALSAYDELLMKQEEEVGVSRKRRRMGRNQQAVDNNDDDCFKVTMGPKVDAWR